VIFKPFVSGEEYAELVKEADIGVLTLTAKNTTPAVPAKLMGYLAAGVPVIAAVHRESDALRIVREASCGFGALSSDSVAILEAFRAAYAARGRLRELGENGRRYLEKHFTQSQGIASWGHVLGEIVPVA
jgi:glycosyltransferase involved in cell wall biosynthesis